MEGRRLSPLFLVESAPDWEDVRNMARRVRNKSIFACVITIIIITIIAVTLFVIDNDTVAFIGFGLLITVVLWSSSLRTDWDALRRVTARASIRARLAAQGAYANAQEHPALELNPGDLACSRDKWTEWNNRASKDSKGPEPFYIVLAAGVKDDGRLLIGLSNSKGSLAPARTGNWKYQMKPWQPTRAAYEKKTYRIAGAITDLVEIAPLLAAPAGPSSPALTESVTQYLKMWSAAEALNALLIARALALIKVVFPSPQTPSQLQARHALKQADRLLAPAGRRNAAVSPADILAISRAPFLGAPSTSKLLTLIRLTELGELWRDSGRPARHKAARLQVLQWLSEDATAENPRCLQKYPVRRRAAGDHFFSWKDLISALRSLEQAGYVTFRDEGGSLSAWPTARGISYAKEAPDMTESGAGHEDRRFTVHIGDISGSQVSIGDGATLNMSSPVDFEELRAYLRTIGSMVPHISLAPEPKAEFERALEQATTEASKATPDRSRLAAALRTIGTVLVATGENVLANVLAAWLAKLGFPGLGS